VSALTELVTKWRDISVSLPNNYLHHAERIRLTTCVGELEAALAATPAVGEDAPVYVTPDEMAALHALSKHTWRLLNEVTDCAFGSLVNRCRVAPEGQGHG
jgi:hypothetical protein